MPPYTYNRSSPSLRRKAYLLSAYSNILQQCNTGYVRILNYLKKLTSQKLEQLSILAYKTIDQLQLPEEFLSTISKSVLEVSFLWQQAMQKAVNFTNTTPFCKGVGAQGEKHELFCNICRRGVRWHMIIWVNWIIATAFTSLPSTESSKLTCGVV